MTDPKQSTAKVVLNAITYKTINDGEKVGIPVSVDIDITDLLEQNNVLPGCVHGVSIYDGAKGEFGDFPGHTAFVISDVEIRQMVDEFFNVIDAAIVNTNQSKASKRLIDNILCSFLNKWWDKIRG